MRSRAHITMLVLLSGLVTADLSAQGDNFPEHWSTSVERSYSLAPSGGALIVDNAIGRIWIEAAPVRDVSVEVAIHVRARNEEVLKTARTSLKLHIQGNEQKRVVRVIGWKSARSEGWTPQVDLRITVPVETRLTAMSAYGALVSVTGVKGNIFVKTYKGDVVVREPRRSLHVTSINGDILCELSSSPAENVRLSTVNGSVSVEAPGSARFEWIAETLNGTIRGPAGVRGSFQQDRPTMFRAVLGSGSGDPDRSVTTASSTGDVTLSDGRDVVPVIRPQTTSTDQEEIGDVFESVVRNLMARPSTKEFAVRRRSTIGNVRFDTKIGNIFLGEHRGNARLSTGAGEIVAGRVIGSLAATTMGGPINVGQVTGTIDLDTAAGAIYVVAAPRGGSARTGGGSVAIRSAGGPLTISSAGGDILVEKALADVNAFTRSGDIRVQAGEQGRLTNMKLETREGSIVLQLPERIRADIEVTLLVEDEMADVLLSQFGGLSVVRDRYEGRGRVRAMGQINGGGAKIELIASDGQVHLLSR